jgi:hypothetical protein
MKIRTAIVATAICLGLHPVSATPAALLNKTINISWFQQTPGLAVGTNRSVSSGRAITITVYVSSAGRVFAKLAANTGQFSGDKTFGPEASVFRSAGSKLVGVWHHGGGTNGATNITVNFDAGFQTCSLGVILGSENGKPLTWIGLDGVSYVATGHPTISRESCSVSNGNPFAG